MNTLYTLASFLVWCCHYTSGAHIAHTSCTCTCDRPEELVGGRRMSDGRNRPEPTLGAGQRSHLTLTAFVGAVNGQAVLCIGALGGVRVSDDMGSLLHLRFDHLNSSTSSSAAPCISFATAACVGIPVAATTAATGPI